MKNDENFLLQLTADIYQGIFARVVLEVVLHCSTAVKCFRKVFRFIYNALYRIHFTIQHAADGSNNVCNQDRAVFGLDLCVGGFVALEKVRFM